MSIFNSAAVAIAEAEAVATANIAVYTHEITDRPTKQTNKSFVYITYIHNIITLLCPCAPSCFALHIFTKR